MTWTLWRGEEIIGEVLPRVTKRRPPGQVSGVLLPRPDVALPKSGSQHRIALPGHSWVVELLDAADRPSASGELKRLAGSPLGLPPDQQLSIRNAADEVVSVGAISVHEHRLHPDQPVEEVTALPEGAILDGSVWLVDFWLESDAPAT